jgi:hypothetical protein
MGHSRHWLPVAVTKPRRDPLKADEIIWSACILAAHSANEEQSNGKRERETSALEQR